MHHREPSIILYPDLSRGVYYYSLFRISYIITVHTSVKSWHHYHTRYACTRCLGEVWGLWLNSMRLRPPCLNFLLESGTWYNTTASRLTGPSSIVETQHTTYITWYNNTRCVTWSPGLIYVGGNMVKKQQDRSSCRLLITLYHTRTAILLRTIVTLNIIMLVQL